MPTQLNHHMPTAGSDTNRHAESGVSPTGSFLITNAGEINFVGLSRSLGSVRRIATALVIAFLATAPIAACSPSEASAEGASEPAVSATNTAGALNPAANVRPEAMENLPKGFDLQSHRGGRGQWTEESKLAMQNSLKLGVTTLELDIVLSKDGVPVVWHDPKIKSEKCSDTQPISAGDPQFPYVGKLVHDLTFQQLATLDCGKKLEDFPDAEVAEHNTLLTLPELFELANGHPDVHFNIETKIEGEKRGESAEPEEFASAILDAVDAAGVSDRVMIQSFDWRSLPLVAKRNPTIPLVLLWDETTWKKDSLWTGDVNFDEVNGDIIEAARRLGVQVLSPGHAVPFGRKPSDPDYHPVATPDFVSRAHQAGLAVVPWTVNDEETMREQIRAGVDGLITDYPARLKDLLTRN